MQKIMPIESFLKLLQPGRFLFLYGGEEHGFPSRPIFVQIIGHHMDKEEVEYERKAAENISDPEKRAQALKLFAEPGIKIFAQVTPEESISTIQLEQHLKGLRESRKRLPVIVNRYLELRAKIPVPEFIDAVSTPEEIELYQLHQFISQYPKEHLAKLLTSDQDRYNELMIGGIVLKSKNKECQTDLELELLKLHRKLKIK